MAKDTVYCEGCAVTIPGAEYCSWSRLDHYGEGQFLCGACASAMESISSEHRENEEGVDQEVLDTRALSWLARLKRTRELLERAEQKREQAEDRIKRARLVLTGNER